MATEKEFYDYCDSLPLKEEGRMRIADMAWENSWSDGARSEYKSDEEAWDVAIATAQMIADSPADYGIADICLQELAVRQVSERRFQVTYDGSILGDDRGYPTEQQAVQEVFARVAKDVSDARRFGRPALYFTKL